MKSMLQTSSNSIAVPQRIHLKEKKPNLYKTAWLVPRTALYQTPLPHLSGAPQHSPLTENKLKRLIISGNGLEIGSTPG